MGGAYAGPLGQRSLPFLSPDWKREMRVKMAGKARVPGDLRAGYPEGGYGVRLLDAAFKQRLRRFLSRSFKGRDFPRRFMYKSCVFSPPVRPAEAAGPC